MKFYESKTERFIIYVFTAAVIGIFFGLFALVLFSGVPGY